MGLAPAWMVAVIIGREFAVTGLRSLAYSRGVAIAASPLGKIKMIAQVVAILALILSSAGRATDALWWTGQVSLWLVLAAALVSAAGYFRRFGLFSRHDVIARDDRVA
jgi:CDP-diacylglycerol--glycerol-3-phosphate 3-phosphatidyltransferase